MNSGERKQTNKGVIALFVIIGIILIILAKTRRAESYYTEYHIVWIPKYRYHVLNPGVQAYLVKLFPKVMVELRGAR